VRKTDGKILQYGFYWLTLFKDVYEYYKCWMCYQQLGRVSKKDMMPLTPVTMVDIFDVWKIDFMRLFPKSFGNE